MIIIYLSISIHVHICRWSIISRLCKGIWFLNCDQIRTHYVTYRLFLDFLETSLFWNMITHYRTKILVIAILQIFFLGFSFCVFPDLGLSTMLSRINEQARLWTETVSNIVSFFFSLYTIVRPCIIINKMQTSPCFNIITLIMNYNSRNIKVFNLIQINLLETIVLYRVLFQVGHLAVDLGLHCFKTWSIFTACLRRMILSEKPKTLSQTRIFNVCSWFSWLAFSDW
jgi:hypothetical protein